MLSPGFILLLLILPFQEHLEEACLNNECSFPSTLKCDPPFVMPQLEAFHNLNSRNVWPKGCGLTQIILILTKFDGLDFEYQQFSLFSSYFIKWNKAIFSASFLVRCEGLPHESKVVGHWISQDSWLIS